jgi:hypothetical protein
MSDLPDSEDFRALLRSLAVKEEPSAYPVPLVSMAAVLSHGQGSLIRPQYLHFDEQPQGRIKALQAKIETALRQANHPHDPEIVTSVLCVYAVNRRLFPDELAFFNSILNSVVDADVSHYIVLLSGPYKWPKWEYFGYGYSSVGESSLRYRSEKAGSDYYSLYRPRLGERPCMSSPVFRRSVIAFLDILNIQQQETRNPMSEAGYAVLLNYYEHLSRRYLDQMWDDLAERHLIPAAFNKAAIDLSAFRRSVGSESVTVFLNQSQHRWGGYVVPLQNSFHVNTVDGESEVVRVAKHIEESMGYSQPEIVRQICRFGVLGHDAFRHQKHPEAFLFFMIGIELLLSSRENTTKAIARRTAVLTSVPDVSGFMNRQKEVEALYGLRSQYVHAGKMPSEKATEDLTQIYLQILNTVLSAPPRGDHPEKAHQDWLKNLDFVASGYDAGHLPSDHLRELLALPAFPHVI